MARSILSVLILGMIMVLSGCGGSPKQVPFTPSTTYDPPPGPSTSGNPGSSPAPTGPASAATGIPADVPTVATNPTVAGERPPVPPPMVHTQTGAITFAEFFMKTVDWEIATDDNHYVKHYFASTCAQCIAIAAVADNHARDGLHSEGGRSTLVRAAMGSRKDLFGAELTVDVYVATSALAVVNASGTVVSGDPAYPDYHEQLLLKWGDAGWVVVAAQGTTDGN